MWWVVSLLLFLPYLIHWFPLFRRVCGWSSDPYHGTMLASTVSQVCQLSSWSSWHWVCQEPGKVRTWLVSFLALLVIACFILHFDSSCYCVIFRPLCKQCNSEFRTGTKKFCAKCRYSEAAVLDNVCNVHPLLLVSSLVVSVLMLFFSVSLPIQGEAITYKFQVVHPHHFNCNNCKWVWTHTKYRNILNLLCCLFFLANSSLRDVVRRTASCTVCVAMMIWKLQSVLHAGKSVVVHSTACWWWKLLFSSVSILPKVGL